MRWYTVLAPGPVSTSVIARGRAPNTEEEEDEEEGEEVGLG